MIAKANLYQRRKSKGQALVEFAIFATLMFFMVAATFEIGRFSSLYLRIASTSREAGLLASSAWPNVTTASSTWPTTNEVETEVYTPILEMISPADLNANGRVIVSLIQRDDPNGDSNDDSDPDTYDDDQLIVLNQYTYGNGAWASHLGNTGDTVPEEKIGLFVINGDDTLFTVEIFYKVETVFPEGILQGIKLDYIYDMAYY